MWITTPGFPGLFITLNPRLLLHLLTYPRDSLSFSVPGYAFSSQAPENLPMLLESVLSLKCPLTTEPTLKHQGQTFPQLTWLRMDNKEFSASLWGSNALPRSLSTPSGFCCSLGVKEPGDGGRGQEGWGGQEEKRALIQRPD